MSTKFIRIIFTVMCALLMLGSFASCSNPNEITSGGNSDGTVTNSDKDSRVLELFELLQENEVMPFTITEKAKVMLGENTKLFVENKKDGLEAYTDNSIEYKMLNKNIAKYGDKLIYLPEAYVVAIYETDLDEETTLTEFQLVDADENSYYCFSMCTYENIFEGDIVSAYALPIGEAAFENVSGSTTLTIVLAGCCIEEIESFE